RTKRCAKFPNRSVDAPTLPGRVRLTARECVGQQFVRRQRPAITGDKRSAACELAAADAKQTTEPQAFHDSQRLRRMRAPCLIWFLETANITRSAFQRIEVPWGLVWTRRKSQHVNSPI